MERPKPLFNQNKAIAVVIIIGLLLEAGGSFLPPIYSCDVRKLELRQDFTRLKIDPPPKDDWFVDVLAGTSEPLTSGAFANYGLLSNELVGIRNGNYVFTTDNPEILLGVRCTEQERNKLLSRIKDGFHKNFRINLLPKKFVGEDQKTKIDVTYNLR